MLAAGQAGQRASRMLDLSGPTPDFTQISTGLGVPATRVTTAGELDRALRLAYAEPGPHLIEAIVPAVVPPASSTAGKAPARLPLVSSALCRWRCAMGPDDVRRAKDGGVDGIYCSNHGGRQADGGLPALDCLPAVVDAADGLPVLFDSGVRSGADVIKALSLGATAVAVGRPYAYGLAIGGTDGIVHVLRSILAEADLIMAVDGYPTLADLTRDSLRRICHHD